MRDRLNWASDQIERHILPDGSRIVTGHLGGVNPLESGGCGVSDQSTVMSISWFLLAVVAGDAGSDLAKG